MIRQERLQHYLPLPLTSFVFVFSYIFIYYFAPPLFAFPDVPWHLMAGREMLADGQIPETNLWSFTEPNAAWYNISWLFDLVVGSLEKCLGTKALYHLQVGLAALIVTIACQNCITRGVSAEIIIIMALVIAFVMYLQTTLRPHLFSLIFALIFQGILHRGRQNLALYNALPLLMILWINSHGGFLVGFVLLGAYAVEFYLKKQKKALKKTLIITVLCAMALLVNPYGWNIFKAASLTLDSVIVPYIIEWQPVKMFSYIGVTLFLFMFVLVTDIRNRAIPLADKIITFTWLVMGLHSVRMFAFFLVLSAPYVALSLSRFKHAKNESFNAKAYDKKEQFKAIVFSVTLFVLFVSFVSFNNMNQDKFYSATTNVQEEISYLQKNFPRARILNFYDYGGEIIHSSRGQMKVFIDGRAETAYSRQLVQHYIDIATVKDNWNLLLNKYYIDIVLYPVDHPLGQALRFHNGWKLIYNKNNKGIFVRSGQ